MHNYIVASATILASVAGVAAATKAITFNGFPSSGTYHDVTSFNMMASPPCSMQPTSFSGANSPLDEELSAIFRGPMQLKQFAVYTQDTSSSKKRSPRQNTHHRRHGHQHFHEHNKEIREAGEHQEKRGYGARVTATIDGKVDVFTDTWDKPAASPAAAPPPAVAAPEAAMGSVTPAAPAPAAPTVKAGAGNWGRTAYYNAASATAEGLTFLANVNWSPQTYMKLGATLGFVTPNGLNSSSEPQILEDCLVPDNSEFIISSSTPCVAGDSCGTTAPGANAHHGFGGAEKMFMVEFQMPLSGQTGYLNADMPAFWLLNSKIVNTQQYAACSCWATGCGEWDIHEILTAGATTGFASMHMGMNYAGTPPEGFARPTGSTMKMAAIVSGGVAHIQVLDDSTSFGSVISGSTVSGFLNQPSATQFKVLVGT